MPTPAEIERQVQLETKQVELGVHKLHKQTRKLEEQAYASASIYGNSIVSDLLPALVEHLEQTEHRIKTRNNGPMYAEIKTFLECIEKEEACLIALKVFIDKVFSRKKNENTVVNVSQCIGQAIECECQMRFYEKTYPMLLKSIVDKYWHDAMGTHQKTVTTRTLWNRVDDVEPWKAWPKTTKIKIGQWYVDAICQITNWFKIKHLHKGHNIFDPSETFYKYQEKIFELAELFCPLKLPMVSEPNNWSIDGQDGGYYTNRLVKNCDFIRRDSKGGTRRGQTPVEFLNKIQQTSFKINQFVADVSDTLWEQGIEIGKFKPIKPAPVVSKPADIATNAESRKNYCRTRAEIENEHRTYLKKTVRTRITLETLKMFRDEEKFYHAYSFDYRGRCYPIATFLSPQADDFGKSLLQFYEGSFVTPEAEEWLAFQVATCYGNGLDKCTMQERNQWAKDNESLIHAIATDPIGRMSDWEVADEPFQFLSACEEYNACVIECTRQFTHGLVAVDASCSGIQVLAGLARDESAAKLVNVTPSDTVQDAYAVIAETSKPHIPIELHHVWNRKAVKRCVMTLPYNSKPHSNRVYIREALREHGIEIEPKVLTEVVNAVRDAMYEKVPGPMAVMAWIEKEVSNAFKRGVKELEWVTPSGFIVKQKLNKYTTKTVKTKLYGKRVEIEVGEEGDEPDIRHHKNATSPNLIHSLDASLLHLTALKFDAPIALIHDSVLCRATDMSSLNTMIRETYRHLFAENDFLTEFAKQIGAETEPPIIGDLDPKTVTNSTYFFC
ncbi:MAG: T7 RNA polymerase [Gammaproteobacteria bacterium]|nr:T7 RNA polymerase [Gammaproteobacteria bacterium]